MALGGVRGRDKREGARVVRGGARAFTSDPRAGRAALKVGAPPEGRWSRDAEGARTPAPSRVLRTLPIVWVYIRVQK